MMPTTGPSENPSDQQPSDPPGRLERREEVASRLADMTAVDLADLSHDDLLEFARLIDICERQEHERPTQQDAADGTPGAPGATALANTDRGAANNHASGIVATPLGRATSDYLQERALSADDRIAALKTFYQERTAL